MDALLSTSEVFDIEHSLIHGGTSVEQLMDRAGLAIFSRLTELYPKEKFPLVGVLVGTGHNGGDGLVVARELHQIGYGVLLFVPTESGMKPLTQKHFAAAKHLGIGVVKELDAFLAQSNLIVDALFGVGLSRPLESRIASIIEAVNTSKSTVVAIDVPSGMNSDNGQAFHVAIRASRTLCIGAYKLGFASDESAPLTGVLECLDIGFDKAPAFPRTVRENTAEHWRGLLPCARHAAAHKYEVGELLVVAGSDAYPGSAMLATLAAREAGAGYIRALVPTQASPSLAALVPDAVVTSLESLRARTKPFQAILMGPGMGMDAAAQRTFDEVVALPSQLVLDADGLSLAAKTMGALPARTAPTVLTPHAGEFARLFPELAQQLVARRVTKIEAVRKAAVLSQSTVVFKGPRTVIASPHRAEARVQLQTTAALARAGTGDVLAGIVAALISQGLEPFDAACAAVGWHSHTALELERRHNLFAVNAYRLARSLSLLL